ncbi:MAG TPA: carboxypeptidase regulatory-like domain-containing protein [Bacteroidota bacterium]|nr:carboxypeptidase regulatory-like domain-containing protein [Bacteroidota bacterium]
MRRLQRTWSAMIVGLLLALSATLQAQEPTFKLFLAQIQSNGTVRLAWTRPAGVAIDTYEIYRSEGADISHAQKVGETKDTSIVDKLPMTFAPVSAYSYYIVGKTLTTVVVKSNVVVVWMNGIPVVGSFKLDAKVDEDDSLVQLSWTKPPVDTVLKYYVYRYGGVMSSIQLIDSTNAQTLTDKPASGVNSGLIGYGDHSEQMKFMYTYYVQAKIPGRMLQSTSAVVFFSVTIKRDEVTFLSTPVTTGQVNVEYNAKVLAKSSDSTAKISYVLDKKPDGMTLDLSSAVPVLKWTPKFRGFFGVRVIAKSDKGGQAVQEYVINVAGGNGVVQGRVTDTSGTKPIARVIIQIMKRDSSRSTCFTYETMTDANGDYYFTKLDPGTYILQAIPTSAQYLGQWWNGKRNADEADRLTVGNSTASTPFALANFKLRGRISESAFVTVKGSVKDTSGILPVNVKGTRVVFTRSDFALNSSTSDADVTIDNFKKFFDNDRETDFRFEGMSQFSFKAAVDSLGNYSIRLPKGSYVALARAPGYVSEFYKDQTDLLSADVLTLNADSSNINFTLAPLPPIVLGEMSGSVIDTAKNVGVRARVIAFRDGWTTADGYKIAKNYFTDTDSLGKFKFTELIPGSYIVMAVPMGGYVPAYYNSGDTSLVWKRATKIVINGNSVSGIDIFVKQMAAAKNGFTWISGTVKSNSGAKTVGVPGAIVTAVDANNQMAGYGITDQNGGYTILDLAPDKYTVTVDKAGYSSPMAQTASPTYNMSTSLGATNAIQASVSFSIESVTGVETQSSAVVPADFTVGQNYPNPFNPSTKFSFTLPTSQYVTVGVYDLLGRQVASLVNSQMNAGSYTVEWNASAMTTGIYFYRVKAGATSIVKKMMLLK